MKKDFFGVLTDIGDHVALIEPGHYNLISGVVERFTPKGLKVCYLDFFSKSEKEACVCEGEFVRRPDLLG